jgi:translation initiation factor 2 subunit 3
LQDAPFSAQKLLVMIDIDPSKLHPLSPEVISKQATINVGTYFHLREKNEENDGNPLMSCL